MTLPGIASSFPVIELLLSLLVRLMHLSCLAVGLLFRHRTAMGVFGAAAGPVVCLAIGSADWHHAGTEFFGAGIRFEGGSRLFGTASRWFGYCGAHEC